jgi:hypothetical protein
VHELLPAAAVVVRLPPSVTLRVEGATMNVRCVPIDGVCNTDASFGTVLQGNAIRIYNLVPEGGEPAPVGSTFKLAIEGVINPTSSRDAGPYSITTENKIANEYWKVDFGQSPTSFTPFAGKISPKGEIAVNKPTNAEKYATYTLSFKIEDLVPSAGYIAVEFPPEVKLERSSTLSTEVCKIFTCVQVE